MDFDGGFRAMGVVDSGLIADLIEQISRRDPWGLDTRRQDVYGVHKQTKSVILKFSETPGGSYETIWPEWEGLVRPIIDSVVLGGFGSQIGGGFIKVIIALMPGGTKITPHCDTGLFWKFAHRIHVPLVTNPGVTFCVDGVDVPTKVGKAFEMANTRLHSVRNDGTQGRIHLIFDYVEPETVARWGQLMESADK